MNAKATVRKNANAFLTHTSNNRGITLVALVVTIIVLLILAGVSISLVLGNNGVITKASTAVTENRKATAQEDIAMAWASCETDYLNEWTKNTSLVKSEYLSPDTIANKFNNQYLTGGQASNISREEDGSITGTYTSDDKNTNVKFTINTNGTVTIGEAAESGTVTPPPVEEVGTYLVDKVNIGDYVDIGIPYKNVQSFTSGYTTTNTALTGWRVLSKEGAGATGSVKLVSAGCPLTYYHSTNAATSIANLGDLYKTISIVNSSIGFRKSGFSEDGQTEKTSGNEDLVQVFGKCAFIDTTKQIHALGCSTHRNGNSGSQAEGYEDLNEVEKAYQDITGQEKTMDNFWDASNPFKTSDMQNAASDKWKESYTDLLGIGQYYWLGGSSWGGNRLWYVYNYGSLGNDYGNTYGVRPVVSLKSGVKVSETEGKDGITAEKAYTITE